MARLGVKEEEKLLFVKYVNILSSYIHQCIEFLTISMIADTFHYTSNIEANNKGKSHFTTNLIGQKSDKKSLANFDKFKNPSQQTQPKADNQKKKLQKDKRDHNK